MIDIRRYNGVGIVVNGLLHESYRSPHTLKSRMRRRRAGEDMVNKSLCVKSLLRVYQACRTRNKVWNSSVVAVTEDVDAGNNVK